jgi:hypothetical protein
LKELDGRLLERREGIAGDRRLSVCEALPLKLMIETLPLKGRFRLRAEAVRG